MSISINVDVDIDVWWYGDGGYWLGHDKPQYHVDENFLENPRLWCHAKNYEAFQALQKQGHNCFWHNEDKYTLTSHGYIWAYPGEQVGANTIAVLPEWKDTNIKDAAGICSDNIKFYKDFFEDNNMDTE